MHFLEALVAKAVTALQEYGLDHKLMTDGAVAIVLINVPFLLRLVVEFAHLVEQLLVVVV